MLHTECELIDASLCHFAYLSTVGRGVLSIVGRGVFSFVGRGVFHTVGFGVLCISQCIFVLICGIECTYLQLVEVFDQLWGEEFYLELVGVFCPSLAVVFSIQLAEESCVALHIFK